MSDDKTFIFRTAEFSGMLEQWAARSKRDTNAVMAQYGRLLMGDIIQVTPPGSEKVKGLQAKKLGEHAIETDIRRLFYPVKFVKEDANSALLINSMDEIAAGHKANRNRRGRVGKRAKFIGAVNETLFKRYLKEKLKQVGKLAAGWAPAAVRLGAGVPAWIKRHTSPGDVVVEDTPDYYLVRATNRVGYVTQQYNLTTSLARAMAIRESKMKNALEYQVQQAANQVK